MLVPCSGSHVWFRGVSVPLPAKGFTTTALRATLADALMTETRVQAKAGEDVLRRQERAECREGSVGKVRYACRPEAACKMEKGRGSQRWLAGPAATGIGLLSDLTWGGLSGTGTAPLRAVLLCNYLTPDGDMSCRVGYGGTQMHHRLRRGPQGHRVAF